MVVLIVIGVIIVVAGISFLSSLVTFKNKVLEYHEEIKKAKSRVRVTQNQYVKAVHNTNDALKINSHNPGAGYFGSGDMSAAAKYDSNIEFVSQLAKAYESAQNHLNNLVNEYNKYIGAFPRSILTSIFKYQPENYIDESNLDQSIALAGIDYDVV